MSKHTVDYDKSSVTNINDYYPTNLQNGFVRNLNDVTFNRFLTKKDYKNVIGAIGSDDPSSSVKKISEESLYSYENQLQPVLTAKLGPEHNFLSWKDFLRKLSQQDVDVERYDTWGQVRQFNWVPPIDLDKFVNFRDYYWDSSVLNSKPDYVTIKNNNIHRATINQQLIKSVVDTMLEGERITSYDVSTNVINLSGNYSSEYSVGSDVCIKYVNNKYSVTTVVSSVFNVATSNTEIELFSLDDSEQPESIINCRLQAYKDTLDPSVIVIPNYNLNDLLSTGYVFGLVDILGVEHFVSVKTFEYTNNNATKININETVSGDISYVNLAPLLNISKFASEYEDGFEYLNYYTNEYLYKLLWSFKLNKVYSNSGATSISNFILTDTTVDFNSHNVEIGDKLSIILPNNTEIVCTITAVNQHTVQYSTDMPQYIYSFTGLNYIIYTNITPTYYDNTGATFDGKLWYSETDDTLYRYVGGQWEEKYKNISLLYNIISNKIVKYDQNEWSNQNSWVHKTQITTVSGKIRAQVPIIEFDNSLKLSDMSLIEHDWSYRVSDNETFYYSAIEPKNSELQNVEILDNVNLAFIFNDQHTIIFDPMFGNMTDGYTVGSKLVLSGFNVNNGTYEIVNSVFSPMSPNSNYSTIITVVQRIPDTSDSPLGSKIHPEKTSHGDKFVSPYVNWRYDGINNVVSSSVEVEKNNLNSTVINVSTTTKSGYNWQTFSFVTGSQVDPILTLDSALHKLCLYDDYGEGDIRVYINNKRQYSNFIELPSAIDDRYVGAIQFIGNVVLSEHDIVLIEVGSYALQDSGRESVVVNTPDGYQLVNLSRYTKNEQLKLEISQQPEFVVADSYTKERYRTSSKIFSYIEDNTQPTNPYLLKKIAYKSSNGKTSFMFRQHLLDDKKTLAYLYNSPSGLDYRTIWRIGSNYENYLPNKNLEGDWNIPNNWMYNPHHENRQDNSYLDLYTHFRSIILSQTQEGLSRSITNSYYSDMDINYGLGGTIKDHSGNLDILASLLLYDKITVEELITFGKQQYINSLAKIQNTFLDNIASLFWLNALNVDELNSKIIESVVNSFEQDTKYSFWFGDSTSYDAFTNVGIKNWIATLPQFGLVAPVEPQQIADSRLGVNQIVHHDGHISNVKISPALQEQLFNKIIGSIPDSSFYAYDVVSNDTQPFPIIIDGNVATNGSILIRSNTSTKTRQLYRYDGTNWELVDITQLLINCILDVEKKLYDVSISFGKTNSYDMNYNVSNVKYFDKLESQFLKYIAESNYVDPLSNSFRFNNNNPYTWNYYYSTPSLLPNSNPYVNYGDWRKLYEQVFGTALPHITPWKIQGFFAKPDWWDVEYTKIGGKYQIDMWNNILAGIIPIGKTTPSGDISDGTPSQDTFLYLPVVTTATTDDGYVYGDLLPPYWNSINNNGVTTIRSLFDPNSGDSIVKPNSDFEFGQCGDFEYDWMNSIGYNYDRMVVSFKLDPINFVSKTFGYDLYETKCYPMHKHSRNIQAGNNVLFHGENVNDALFSVYGINQWLVNYNRYQDLDFNLSSLYPIWKESDMKLSYLFDTMIDSEQFTLKSDIMDIVDKDYSIYVKNTKDYEIKTLDALNLTLVSSPSKYLGDTDKGWTVEVSTIPSLKRNILYYGIQNYSVMFNNNEFKVGYERLIDAEYTNELNYLKISYNSTLSRSDELTFNIGTPYSTTINVSGVDTEITIITEVGDTIGDLLSFLNEKLSDTSTYLDLDNGNLMLYSNDPSSVLSITSDAVFSNIIGYVDISSQNSIPTKFNNVLILAGNQTTKYLRSVKFDIVDSTNFDGTYTTNSSEYDIQNDKTYVYVKEDITLPPSGDILVDGFSAIHDGLTLPDDWVDGTEVYFNTHDNLYGLNTERPYYIIRNTANSFNIAKSYSNAVNRIVYSPIVEHDGELYVGKIDRTFKSNGGSSSKINWRIHAIDTRIVKYMYDGISISGMQSVVDFLIGYNSYNNDNGFIINSKNKSGTAISSWETYIEDFIEWSFAQRSVRQQQQLEYKVSFDASDSSIRFTNGSLPNWASGSMVILIGDNGTILPEEFSLSDVINVPYYVVRTQSKDSIKLAYSAYDATNGKHIEFTNPSVGNVVLQIYEKFENKPYYTYCPFTDGVSINHNIGLTSNIFEHGNYVYMMNGEHMDSSQLFIKRSDTQTDISLLDRITQFNSIYNGTTPYHIAGLQVSIQTFEHILSFNDYSVVGDLIYDKFLGLKTPRFFVEFHSPAVRTLRPTVGGYMLKGSTLTRNIEATIDDSRHFYDYIKNENSSIESELLRKSLGYDGPKDYMTNLGIDEKGQFEFWKAMIQNKGTNFTVNAFTNQINLDTAEIDEFWAYKLGTFGGNKQTDYFEMNLFSDDVSKTEMKIEFIPPNGLRLNNNFTPVALTDTARWNNQPDEIRKMNEFNTFFFNTKVDSIISDVANKVIDINGDTVLVLNNYTDYALITYKESGIVKTLVEETDYVFLNALMIKFITPRPLNAFDNLTVATLTYDMESQNPSKVIDKKSGTVISDVPFWNPAFEQYDLQYMAPVSNMGSLDIASYSENIDKDFTKQSNIWLDDRNGFIWVDTKNKGYVPYFDRTIMPNINDRIFNWGKLADWANIEVYQWTKSIYTPEQYDEISKIQSGDYTIPESERISGVSRKNLYKNAGTFNEPIWTIEEDQHIDVICGLLNDTNLPTVFGEMEIYINGKFKYTRTMQTQEDYRYIHDSLPVGTYLHFIKRAHVPNNIELEQKLYTYFTPYTTETKINPTSGREETVYYFWVSNKYNRIITQQKEYTLIGIKNGILNTPNPYMIVQGLRPAGDGYGLVYGNIFDEFGYNLPLRYTQLIVKGLENTVKDDNRYVIRFTKDFNLRDRLDNNSLSKKNLHTEWKLFRERQYGKIDRYLWIKLIESVIGYKMVSDTLYDISKPLPALDRIVYDNLYGKDTRIGFGDDQIFIDSVVARDVIKQVIDSFIDFVNPTEKNILSSLQFDSPAATVNTLNEIYYVLNEKYVNQIFFALLYETIRLKKEHPDIFKTSWVAIQISSAVQDNSINNFDISHSLISGDVCT